VSVVQSEGKGGGWAKETCQLAVCHMPCSWAAIHRSCSNVIVRSVRTSMEQHSFTFTVTFLVPKLCQSASVMSTCAIWRSPHIHIHVHDRQPTSPPLRTASCRALPKCIFKPQPPTRCSFSLDQGVESYSPPLPSKLGACA
jgi:hypothetical protein